MGINTHMTERLAWLVLCFSYVVTKGTVAVYEHKERVGECANEPFSRLSRYAELRWSSDTSPVMYLGVID
jgi:hypothetical protein